MELIIEDCSQRVSEDGDSFFEGDLVLLKIEYRLSRIPIELHPSNYNPSVTSAE